MLVTPKVNPGRHDAVQKQDRAHSSAHYIDLDSLSKAGYVLSATLFRHSVLSIVESKSNDCTATKHFRRAGRLPHKRIRCAAWLNGLGRRLSTNPATRREVRVPGHTDLAG